MSSRLPNETAVVSAIRHLLAAAAAGRGVAEAQTSLITETNRVPLESLERWERTIRSEMWLAADQSPTPRWKFWSRSARFLSWLDLCSGDGFRRERILRSASGGQPNAFFLALAIRRLNDWVPQVRAAAREHVPGLVENSDPGCVADALWTTFAHWEQWARIEDRDRDLLGNFLENERVANAFKERLIEAVAGPAAEVLAQAGRSLALDPLLPEIAVHGKQPSVRARACRSLLEGRVTWSTGRTWVWTDVQWCKGRFVPVFRDRPISQPIPARQAFRIALADRSPRVRRIAADRLITNPESAGSDARTYAERLANDSSSYVAERGRFACRMEQLGT